MNERSETEASKSFGSAYSLDGRNGGPLIREGTEPKVEKLLLEYLFYTDEVFKVT